MALKFEKIKQILNQGCNVVYRLKLEVDAYKSVIDVWKTYKRVNTLGIVTSDRRIIKDIFDFHKTINAHVILYFSSIFLDFTIFSWDTFLSSPGCQQHYFFFF